MSSSHHGERPTPEVEKLMKRFLDQAEKPLRREYPEGRMGADDDGSVAFAVAADPVKGVVIINFNKPVAWLGMPPEQAMQLAQLLMNHAKKIAKEPLVLTV